jgi:4-hydroxy-3-methylbut-2-enyl diphosphate reductase IspH
MTAACPLVNRAQAKARIIAARGKHGIIAGNPCQDL